MTEKEYTEKSTLLKVLRSQWKFWIVNGGKSDKIESLKKEVSKLHMELIKAKR